MGKQILTVDSSKVEQVLLQGLLGKEYTVIKANSGEECIAYLEHSYESVSAVILDLTLSGIDGFEVLRRIKGSPLWQQIPVIVTTGNRDEAAQVRSISLGANSFIIKPFNQTLLMQTVRNIISLCETAALANALRHDKLTGLYNREAFFVEAQELISEHEAGYYVISSLDIDNFKVINDQHGTDVGDKVLCHVGDCLRRAAELTDGIACRISADRFAVMYPYEYRDADQISEIHEQTTRPPCLERTIRPRIGRYVINDTSIPVSAMLDRSLLAGDTIRDSYENNIAEYSEAMREALLKEQNVVSNMRAALDGGQFEAWFQPQYNHSTGALIGAEALARWRHPERGLIPPYEFIPIFERNGFIYELDKYIWEQVCIMLRQKLDAGLSPLPVSVNISRYDVFAKGFFEHLTGLITKYNLPIDLLRLELTESAFSESTGRIVSIAIQLIEFGFTLEIDDFGSGYSSLNTLKDVPAQILKLDLKFLQNSGDSRRSGNIVESINRMAKWLGMSVIAEGVETREQADFLVSIGCSLVRGYFYARPMPRSEYDRLESESRGNSELPQIDIVENFDSNDFWNPASLDTLVFNHFSGGAFIAEYRNKHFEMLRVNDEFAKAFRSKLTNEQILALEPFEGYTDEKLSAVIETVESACVSGKAESLDIFSTLYRGDGQGEYVRVTFRRIAVAGDRYLFYGYVDNISEQHNSAERLRVILDNLNSGVSASYVKDGLVKYIFANSRFYEILGYDRESYTSDYNGAFGHLHPDDRENARQAVIKGNKDKKPYGVDFRIYGADGKIRRIHTSTSVISLPDIKEPVHLAVADDITDMEESVEQLRFLNELSSKILSTSDNENAIYDTLTLITHHFGADRGYIIELDYENRIAVNTYEVCSDGVESMKAMLQRVPFEDNEIWLRPLERSENVFIPSVDALEDEALKELLRMQDITSLFFTPLRRDGKLIGFAGIDNPTQSVSMISGMKAPGDYLSVLLTRRDLLKRINDK